MPRDYAKKGKPKKRGASRKNGKPVVPTIVWVFTFLFVGGLVAGLSYLKYGASIYNKNTQNNTESKSKTEQKKTTDKAQSKTSKSNKQAAELDKESVPIYNIHDDLTNKKVEIPEEDLKPSEDIDKFVYLMPCGSFRESFRADELKATIALTGNSSNINAVKYKGETWYRVELGPFPRKRRAEIVRHRLQDNGIHDCRIIPRLKTSQ